MQEYDLTEAEVLASEIERGETATTAAQKPPAWYAVLANMVGEAFGTKPLLGSVLTTQYYIRGKLCFVGTGPRVEVSVYAFDTLRRQLLRARNEHMRTKLRRVKVRVNKTRRADLFCEGWVLAVRKHVSRLSVPSEELSARQAYMDALGTKQVQGRAADARRDYEAADRHAGYQAGADVRLNHGVGGATAAPKQLT